LLRPRRPDAERGPATAPAPHSRARAIRRPRVGAGAGGLAGVPGQGLYLADEVRDVAAVLASHLIERFEAAYQVAHAYVDARDLRPPTRAELADLAATATTPEGAAKLLAAAIRHAHTFIRSTG